jgi:aminoglycoside phosphotransferase (APT) family kinase protein
LPASTRSAPWRLDVEVGGAARAFVLRLGAQRSEHEYEVLRAMASIAIPTPRAYGWDPSGKALGAPCFLQDFIEGESLLGPMLAGAPWAEDLYLDTVCALQAITRDQLVAIEDRVQLEETATHYLETAYAHFRGQALPLAEAVYARLEETMPQPPASRFSNGDLWLDNILVRDGQLAGVIDWANARFSDPLYEFLLSFFVEPRLRGRGMEERYCQRIGFDPALLDWYRGLELFDTWHWVHATGEPFLHHTAETLETDLRHWLVR